MQTLFGHTRTHVGPRHALITPDGHVSSLIPGLAARCVVHINPALGAGFVQMTIQLHKGQSGHFTCQEKEFFFYVIAGEVAFTLNTATRLSAGGYIYLAPTDQLTLQAESDATLLIFEKKYRVAANIPTPASRSGHESEVCGTAFLGNPKTVLQELLPVEMSFDWAINIFTFQPGATLPFVETHIMEHGLLFLDGQGIYHLEDRWYPVQQGDVIWMAPYCPQWFVAMGDTPARYIYYKDIHRPPLT